MFDSRGYRSYRGRTPRWKILAAVALVLVIAAAVGVIMLQEYVVYDGSGMPHLRLPGGTETVREEPQEEEEVELVIQPAPEAPHVHVLSLQETPLTAAGLEAADTAGYDALAVTLKDSAGRVYFDASAVTGAVRTADDTAAALAALTAREELHTVARISCFHDPPAANAQIDEMGLKNTGGYIFYDGSNSQWLDPAKPAARQYLCALARAAAELGFDEILLTDVSYPTEGKLDKVAYGDGDAAAIRRESLEVFLEEMRAALEPYEVTLSVELSQETVRTGADEAGGMTLSAAAAAAERIYVPAEASQAEALAEAVAAAGEDVDFVPELTAPAPDLAGSVLVLQG